MTSACVPPWPRWWPERQLFLAVAHKRPMPGAMHAGFAQFAAFDQDARDNKAFLAAKGKLAMPVLVVGGEKSFGPMMATVMRFAASDVTEAVIPESGHWIMEENPAATIAVVRAFLGSK